MDKRIELQRKAKELTRLLVERDATIAAKDKQLDRFKLQAMEADEALSRMDYESSNAMKKIAELKGENKQQAGLIDNLIKAVKCAKNNIDDDKIDSAAVVLDYALEQTLANKEKE